MFERMTWDAAPPLREAGGIAIVAAGSNLRTTRHRIPRRICPLDCTAVGHNNAPLERTMNLGISRIVGQRVSVPKLENMSKMNEKGMDSCCKYYS